MSVVDEARSVTVGDMWALRLCAPGGVEALMLEQIAKPSLKKGDVLVRVHAAAVTRDELEWPVDRLPAIPSYELSGVVAALADGVEDVSVGEAVYALTPFDRDGVAAEFAAVPAAILAPKPHRLGHVESAAVPLAALSAWQGLFEHGRLEAGQRVLVHGAAGGVGHFAVQLARWRGAHVIGTISPGSAESPRTLGAHQLLDLSALFEDPPDPVDLVFDTVGGELLAGSPALVREGGRIVSVAASPPDDVEATYFVVEPNRAQLIELVQLVDSGLLHPTIDSVFPLTEARAAFERSLARGKHGKVVLQVVDE